MPSRKSASSKKKKQQPAKTTAPSTGTAVPKPSGPPIRIRMYRQGLGDCFLVTFNPGGQEVHMLIDCGTLGATTTGVKLADVVADIAKTTQNHLHLLVATHEHKDHISGFYDLQDQFKRLKVDNVWLAWTENPKDDLAREIVKYKGDLGETAAAASRALLAHKDNPAATALGAAVQDILAFTGDPKALGAFAKTMNDAMEFVRTGLGVEAEYLSPGGKAIQPSWLPGFRFYVLGPPRSKDAIADTGAHGSAELYGLAPGLRAALLPADAPGGAPSDMPFDIQYRMKQNDPLMAGFLREYLKDDESWRRVDDEWLHAAAELALQLDDQTNNTSLVLAIERIRDRKVLLFAADAQQGNWLSWQDVNWTVQDGPNSRTIAANDLLANCVFYKVGHHGSHNATAKEKGLERMQQEKELIAFVPVDRAVALGRNPKNSWQMPARPLYKRLLEKCQGRVLRSDLGWAADSSNAPEGSTEAEFNGLAQPADWTRWQQSQQQITLNKQPLYFEITLK